MPWPSTDPVNERMKFVVAHQSSVWSMSELCRRYGISRETGYTWLERFRQEGPAGLEDRSHAPRRPRRMTEEMEGLLLSAKDKHPHWGPRKVRVWLASRHPGLLLPAASTVGELLKRRGLVKPRSRPSGYTPPPRKPLEVDAPNQVWAGDFKGQFRTRDGRYCYPLTATDAHTRFLLCCYGLRSTRADGALAGLEAAFRAYGLPEAIRTDNGYPFAMATTLGLTQLNVWWTKLGIRHDRIQPGRPEQNSRHERMHRTLKAETASPPGRDLVDQQERFDRFREEFNTERPHEALNLKTPSSAYQASARPMPSQLPKPEYDGHFEVRRVRTNGRIQFLGRDIFVSDILIGEHLALEEVDDGIWAVRFYRRLLGRLSERTGRVSAG